MADANTSKKNERKVKIHRTTTPEDMYQKIVNYVNDALDKCNMEKDIATAVKKKCDEELSGTWHCVVGRNFGCSITHDTKYVLFFQIDQMHVMCFKSLE